ncbi:MAG: calcium/sodium antiporter [Prolixibacteraceae bacterium]|jgi:cation:H+ antiporter|nr:calcium/sodium antiporter [Prolixibacteraceae bacterium]NLX27477.1 calcium/sodium antiporter [Bacteroidales bacterium]HNQ37901.1 calcium/sodium antiporter [Prolixibacteraceae bacterium]
MWHFILLLAGFLPLIYGANLLVDYASALAKRFNIPNLVIGLTIVAFGTSAPELVVNLFASLGKNSGIVMGNVVGSNIFNIGVIMAISAIIFPLAVKNTTTWIEVPLALLAGVVVLIQANDMLIDGDGTSVLTRIDGLMLLLFFIIFLAYNYTLMKKGDFSEEFPVKDTKPWKSVLLILAGLALLVAGGRMIVYGAIEVATRLGIPERIIGLTIVSIGTSLPELATSIVAARKKNTDIAVGNIVGSNIFNIFFILGTSAVIYPVTVHPSSNIDLLMNIVLSTMIFIFIFAGKGKSIDRKEGTVMLFFYLGYLTYLITMPA